MPITPALLKTRRKAVTFDYLGETVHLQYYPAAIGPDSSAQAQAIQDALTVASAADDEAAMDAALHDLGAWLTTILASWDFMQDDGVTPQAITAENLAALVVQFGDFMQAVTQAIMADRNGGNTPQGNASGTPSPASSGSTSVLTD